MTGVVQGHFGELLQGRIGPDGPVALVTLPCPAFTATARFSPGPVLRVRQNVPILPPDRAAAMLQALNLSPAGTFALTLTMPPGGGAGASSAALMALALAAGARGAEKIGEIVSVHVIPRPHENVDRALPLGRASSGE